MSASEAHLVVDWGLRLEIDLIELGMACCAVEVDAALGDGRFDPAAYGVVPTGQGTASVLVVSGTVTDALLPGVLARYRELAEPRYVVSVGACSNTGGPYWDSYSVTKGIDQVLPVHVAVPGCPPRPEAVLAGLAALHRLVAT